MLIILFLSLSGPAMSNEFKRVTVTIHSLELKDAHDDGGSCNSCLEIYLNIHVNSDFSKVPARYYNNITPGNLVNVNKVVTLHLRDDDPLVIKVTAYDSDPNSEDDPLGTVLDRYSSVLSAKGIHHKHAKRPGNGSYYLTYSVDIE